MTRSSTPSAAVDRCAGAGRIRARRNTAQWGDHDRFLPPYWGERLHRAIPNSTFRLLTGCGHFCMVDNSGLVAQELLGHLQQATARRVAAAHFSAAQPAPSLPEEPDPALTPNPPAAPA